MDGMDSFIYSLVLVPALRDLLPRSGIPASNANIGYYGGLLFALFMVGWGTALFWGPIADRFGRVRTMMFSISCFSLFTLLAAFATGVWSLAIFRFLAGVGIGGEWSIGAALVSEDWPEERRTMGGALMHTGYYVGFFLAALANYFIGSRFGWRYMFVVGGTPALLVAFIRNNVQEPARWENKLQQLGENWRMHHSFLELFTPRYRRRTIFNSIYLIVSLIGLWAGSVYVPASDDLHRSQGRENGHGSSPTRLIFYGPAGNRDCPWSPDYPLACGMAGS
jgi:MFS family permease